MAVARLAARDRLWAVVHHRGRHPGGHHLYLRVRRAAR